METPSVEYYVCPRCNAHCVRTQHEAELLDDAQLMLPSDKPYVIGHCLCGFQFTRDMREFRRVVTPKRRL